VPVSHRFRAAVLAAAVLTTTGLVSPAPAVAATGTTAWHDGGFRLDRPGVVRRSNVVLGDVNSAPSQSLPLGNGSLGAAVWAAGGFTAQLNRADTFPDRKSPGQVTIPGLAKLTNAPDFAAHLDLYDGVLTETGGGLTARIYVRADSDELVVDVAGADPASAQTARGALWAGRAPAAQASGATGTLAETWVDNPIGGTNQTFGSLLAVTAGGRNVSASVVDGQTVQVSFNPTKNGTYRVVVGAPHWTGGDALGTAARLLGRDATASTVDAGHLRWWHGYWADANLVKADSADGTAQYLENLRTIYLYQEASLNRGKYPGTQAGVADLFAFSQDKHDWVPADYWFWNLRMQIAANLSSGVPSLNDAFFDLYTSNLANIEAWTKAHVPGANGACVPETMRFNGNGYYTGPDPGANASCDSTIAPTYNSLNFSTGAEVSLWLWRSYEQNRDPAFLRKGYPLMKSAAEFLLSIAKTGTDGLLHTTANAHETQWKVPDPVTDILAMRTLFPIVVSAAQTLHADPALVGRLKAAQKQIPPLPRTDAATHKQVLTPADDAAGQDVIAYSAQPAAQLNNSENLDLEATFSYGQIGDAGPLTDLAKRTYDARQFRTNADWSYDALYAARLGLANEVKADLVQSVEKYQLFPSGMANLFGTAGAEPYNEQSGIVAASLNEGLVQDYDGLLRIAPAWPADWSGEGTVSVQHNSEVDVQVRDGVPVTVVLEAGDNAEMAVRSPWAGQRVQVVDAGTGRRRPADDGGPVHHPHPRRAQVPDREDRGAVHFAALREGHRHRGDVGPAPRAGPDRAGPGGGGEHAGRDLRQRGRHGRRQHEPWQHRRRRRQHVRDGPGRRRCHRGRPGRPRRPDVHLAGAGRHGSAGQHRRERADDPARRHRRHAGLPGHGRLRHGGRHGHDHLHRRHHPGVHADQPGLVRRRGRRRDHVGVPEPAGQHAVPRHRRRVLRGCAAAGGQDDSAGPAAGGESRRHSGHAVAARVRDGPGLTCGRAPTRGAAHDSLVRNTFPVALRGSSSRNSTSRGTL
jgi:hypothetical protein